MLAKEGRKMLKFYKKINPKKLRKKDNYKDTIPKNQHSYNKEKKKTNHLDRQNNTIKQSLSRLVRKSLSFSKKLENHIGEIKYFLYNYI